MSKIKNQDDLREAIRRLETLQDAEEQLIKAQANAAFESIKPINLIRSTVAQVAQSKDLQEKILVAAVGLAAGYISKKVVSSDSDNFSRKMLASATQLGITTLIAKHPETIKAIGQYLIRLFRNDPDTPEPHAGYTYPNAGL